MRIIGTAKAVFGIKSKFYCIMCDCTGFIFGIIGTLHFSQVCVIVITF